MMRGLLLILALAGCKDIVVPLAGDDASAPDADEAINAEQTMTDWPDSAKSAARALIQSYGQPDATTSDAVSWDSRGPWKRIVVHREEIKHAFPSPHADVVEQVIDLRVAPDRAGGIVQFDGSLVVSRTRGELTAWGPDEPSNFGLVNLAMSIAGGAKTPDEARQAYTDAMAQAAAGQKPALLDKLQFSPPTGDQGDPDVSTPSPN